MGIGGGGACPIPAIATYQTEMSFQEDPYLEADIRMQPNTPMPGEPPVHFPTNVGLYHLVSL